MGAGNAGSAKQPVATATAEGRRDGYQKTVEPHVPQKWNVTGKPLSEARWKVWEDPVISVAAASKNAAIPNGPPVRR